MATGGTSRRGPAEVEGSAGVMEDPSIHSPRSGLPPVSDGLTLRDRGRQLVPREAGVATNEAPQPWRTEGGGCMPQASSPSSKMTRAEAGRKGGMTTKQRHGDEFFGRIGRIGGKKGGDTT